MRLRTTMLTRLMRSASTSLALVAGTTIAAPTPALAVTVSAVRAVPDPFFSGHAELYGWGATTMLDGDVLIGDYWNYRVRRYAKDGTLKGDFINNPGFGPTQHQAPYGLATDPRNGDIYMADTDRYNIDKYDKDGNYLLSFGTQGEGPGRFLYPSRVAVATDGRVFVADTWANNVTIHTPAGVEVGTLGSFGTGPGQLKAPHGMSVYRNNNADAADDQLFVVDTGNKQVDVFDHNGGWLRSFGTAGPLCKDGQFIGDMRGLAIDQKQGLVYVVDAAGNKVHKFSTAGVPDPSAPCIGSEGTGSAADPAPLGKFTDGGREATVDDEGNLWVGDMPNFRAQKFSPDGTPLLQVPGPTHPSWAPPPGGFNGLRGVAVDKFGNMFVTDTYNQRIQKLNPDGSFNRQWGGRGRDEYALNYPRMIAADPRDGAVVVADTDNHRIKKYDNDGVFICQVGGLGKVTPGTFRNPHGVDVGPDGRIYVTDTRNARIQILDEACNPLAVFGVKGASGGQMTFPRGIAVDPEDESIWVADSGRDIVLHFSNAGTFLGSVGTKGAADNQWSNPFDIEIDGSKLYVADTSTNKIKIWTKGGVFETAFGTGGNTLGKFSQPQGLDLYDGNLYVAEQKNERVQELDLTG